MLPGLSLWFHRHLMQGRTCLFPLVPMALGLVAGILATGSFTMTQRGGFWGCLAFLIMIILTGAWDKESRFRLFGGFGMGVLLTILHVWAPWQTYQRHAPPHSFATLTVQITDPFSDPGPFGLGSRRPRLVARIRDLTLAGENSPTVCRGKILLVMPPGTRVAYGENLRVTGVFSKPTLPVAAGGFDYRRFLLSRGIQHVFQVRTLIRQGHLSGLAKVKRWVYAGRQTLATALIRGFKDKQSARAAVAMTLGYRNTLTHNARRQYIRSGTVHIFSISGLHVGIATTVFLLIARLLGIPLIARFRVLPVVLGAYVFVTGSPTSAVRAWVMISAFSVSFSCLRPHVPLNGLALAALILLLINPLSLFNTGFQFSFTVVTALIAGWRMVGGAVTVCQEKRRWVAKLTTIKYYLHKFRRFCLVIFGCGLAAWLGGAGLLAWKNCLFIPSALWLNVAVALLAFGSLSLAMVKLTLICFGLSALSGPVTGALEQCLTLIRSLAATAATGNGSLTIPQPPLELVVIYYGLLVCLMIPAIPSGWKKLAGIAVVVNLGWMSMGSRCVQDDQCVFIHGGGGGKTACVLENERIPPVFILSGDYSVDMTALTVMKLRGHDTVSVAVCPRYGGEAEQSAAMVSDRVKVERLVVPGRFHLDQLPAIEKVSVQNPSAKCESGLRLPPGIEVDSLSRKDISLTIHDPSGGTLGLTIKRLDKRGITQCGVVSNGRTIGSLSLANMAPINLFKIPVISQSRP